MDLSIEDPVTGAKADPSDPEGSAKSIGKGIGGMALAAGIASAGVAVYTRLSKETGDVTPEFVMD